jgi:uncharacterized protein with GYD domain
VVHPLQATGALPGSGRRVAACLPWGLLSAVAARSVSVTSPCEEVTMPRYLMCARFEPEGAKGVLASGGTARRDAIEATTRGLGGRMESFDFAFGDDDVYTIVELPDHASAAALALTVNSFGRSRVRTTVLLTPEEIDAASGKSVSYTPPGGS